MGAKITNRNVWESSSTESISARTKRKLVREVRFESYAVHPVRNSATVLLIRQSTEVLLFAAVHVVQNVR